MMFVWGAIAGMIIGATVMGILCQERTEEIN